MLSLLIRLKGLVVFKAGVIVASFFLIFIGLSKTVLDWPRIYLDANTAIFIKRTQENLVLIKKFEIKL